MLILKCVSEESILCHLNLIKWQTSFPFLEDNARITVRELYSRISYLSKLIGFIKNLVCNVIFFFCFIRVSSLYEVLCL